MKQLFKRTADVMLFMAMILLISACKDDGPADNSEVIPGVDEVATITDDDYVMEYKYAEGVVVMTESLESDLVTVKSDSILMVSENSELSRKLQAGTVISSGQTEKLPYGLGNKVVSISREGNMVKVVTTSAALDEIFEELKLESSVPIIEKVPQGIKDAAGNDVQCKMVSLDEVEGAPTRATFGRPDALQFSLGYNVTGNGAFVQGTIYMGAIAKFDFDLKQKKYEVSLEQTVGAGCSLGVHGSKDFLNKRLFKAPIAQTVVAYGPLVLRPFLDLEVSFEGSGEGEVKTEFRKFVSLKLGVNENGMINEVISGDKDRDSNITDLTVDGKIGLYLKADLNFGMGLYTKNIAVGIDPYVKVGPEVEFELSNANNWRIDPQIHLKAMCGAEAQIYARFLKYELFSEHFALAEYTFWDWSGPLLPHFVEGSFEVEKVENSKELTFKGSYSLTGGVLPLDTRYSIRPGLKVLRSGEVLQSQTQPDRLRFMESRECEFTITGVEHDVAYTARPFLTYMGVDFEQDGKVFSSITPTAAITDIVQTGSKSGDILAPNGETYNYAFPYYLNVEIKGSALCSEWGLYTPNSMFEENIYKPLELKDGRVTSYWTLYSQQSSGSVSDQRPYAILKDDSENIIYYDGYPKTLYYGGTGAARTKGYEKMRPFAPGNSYLHLDSIMIHSQNRVVRF